MPDIFVHGQRIFYNENQISAQRPSLLLIHGAGGRHDHWPPQVRRMKGVSVYAPDLPGHGRSGGVGFKTIPDYANEIVNFMDALEINQAILGGHSMGGAIVQMMALTAPERVAGLVLVSTGARLRVAPQIIQGIYSDFNQTIELILEYAYGPGVSPDLLKLGRRTLRETPPEVLHDDYAACDGFDVMDRLSDIRVPALVLCGEVDRLTPPKYASYLSERLPDAQLTLMEETGHMLPVEQPERTTGLIQNWISARWPE